MRRRMSRDDRDTAIVSNVTEWFLYDDFESLAMTFRRTDVFFTIPALDDTAVEPSAVF